jgi:hypothetical protein
MLKRRLKEPFGKAGLTVAIFALVLAMVGGAYAAGALSGKQKKEVEKIAKKFAGKPGAAGAQGAPGAPGAAGKNGTNGTNGGAGANGKSVTVTEAGLAECEERGGAIVKPEGGSAVEVCNGEEGAKGKEGSPWVAGGTLPKGSTETGTWAVQAPSSTAKVPISYNIPLPSEVLAEVIPGKKEDCSVLGEPEKAECEAKEKAQEEHCPGEVNEPKAAEGFLCFYVVKTPKLTPNTTIIFHGYPGGSGSGGQVGTVVNFSTTEASLSGEGSWAVTAG